MPLGVLYFRVQWTPLWRHSYGWWRGVWWMGLWCRWRGRHWVQKNGWPWFRTGCLGREKGSRHCKCLLDSILLYAGGRKFYPVQVYNGLITWSSYCQSNSQSPTDLESTQSDSQSPTDLESTQSQNIGNARTKCLYVHEMPRRKSSSGRPVNIIQ